MAGQFDPFVDAISERNFDELVADVERMPGIAVLGAGASSPLPGWRRLYDELRRRGAKEGRQIADGSGGQFDLTTLFEAITKTQTPEWLLGVLRQVLDTTETPLPEIYELLRSIRKIQAIHTFNYDSFLRQSASRENAISHSYPFFDWDRASWRFLYLHGNIQDARTIHDIVLCESDYNNAYNDSSDLIGLLRNYYKRPPVLFAGTSLSDDQFLKSLRDIAGKVQRQPAEDGELIISHPKWYVLLARATEENMSLMSSKMETYKVKPIWYESEAHDHGSLLQVLNMLKARLESQVSSIDEKPDSVLKAREARRLAGLSAPSIHQVNLAVELLADRHARQEFFESAFSPNWLPFLATNGLLQPDEPVSTADGLMARNWPAAGYLARVAGTNPSAVAEYLRGLKTTNWLAMRDVVNALQELPDTEYWSLARRIDEWLANSPHNEPLVRLALVRIKSASAVWRWTGVLKQITQRLGDDESNRYEAMAVGSLATEAFVVAASKDKRVGPLLVDALERYAKARWPDPSEDASWVNKRALDEDEARGRSPGLDWLARTTLTVLSEIRDKTSYLPTLRRALKSEWPFVQRFALVELSRSVAAREKLSKELGVLLEQALDSTALYHEMALVVTALKRGESSADHRLLAVVETRIAKLDAQHPGRSDRWARILGGSASEDDLFLFGPIEIFSPASPLTTEELEVRFGHLPGIEMIRLACRPSDFGIEHGWRQEAELLWDTLADLVERRNRADVLLAITPDVLALQEQAARVVRIAPKLTLPEGERRRVIAWLVSLASSGNRRAEYAALDALIDFARAGSIEHAAESAALHLIQLVGASVHEDLPKGAVWTEGEPPDIMMRQLNDVAGKATQLLVESFLAARRSQPSTASIFIPPWGWSFAQNEEWDFVECRVALGEMFPFLVGSDPERAKATVDRLFQSGTPSIARQAFWVGYCWRARPHRATLDLLSRPMREDVVRISNFVNTRHDVSDQLVAHAAIGWIQNISGFAGLPAFVMQAGDAHSAERFVWGAGQVLNGADDELQRRFAELLAEVVDADRQSGGKPAGGGYSSWLWTLKGIDVENRLTPSLKHIFQVLSAKDVYPALEFLEGLVESHPELALELADSYLVRTSADPEIRWDSRDILRLLGSISDRVSDSAVMSRLAALLLANDVLSVADAESLVRLG